MTAFVATGTTYFESGDFTLAAGTSVILALIPTSGSSVPLSARGGVQLKGSGGDYTEIGALTGEHQGRELKNASGSDCVYRLVRYPNAVAFGIDKT